MRGPGHASAAKSVPVSRHDVLHCRVVASLEQGRAWCSQGQELCLHGSTRAAH